MAWPSFQLSGLAGQGKQGLHLPSFHLVRLARRSGNTQHKRLLAWPTFNLHSSSKATQQPEEVPERVARQAGQFHLHPGMASGGRQGLVGGPWEMMITRSL